MRSPRTGRPVAGAILLAAVLFGACSNAVATGPGAAATIVSTGATNLSGVAGTAIGPFVFVVKDADSNVVPGVAVTFAISGAGTLNTASATTDNGGSVLTTITFTHNVGVATITATASGVNTPATVSATSVADAPSRIVAVGGNGQSSAVGTSLVEPLTVQVSDQYNNPVSNILVNWTSNGGTFGTASSRTGADGRVATTFTPTKTGNITIAATASFGAAALTATGN
jgi:adhesin/invasin